jgi:hypothetical protein
MENSIERGLRWSWAYALLCIASLGAFAAEKSGADFSRLFTVPDIGRYAALTLDNHNRVEVLIREGKLDDALNLLDVRNLFEISLMAEFDHALATDERHVRLRNQVVKGLQREWLERPPQYIDDASAAFLERICSTIPDCPRGRVVGQHPIQDFVR